MLLLPKQKPVTRNDDPKKRKAKSVLRGSSKNKGVSNFQCRYYRKEAVFFLEYSAAFISLIQKCETVQIFGRAPNVHKRPERDISYDDMYNIYSNFS